ncbi:MAG: ATP-binding protein [Candidatus Sumerlaeia bacterium]|nr:ATP-binding protein [Candidatus Sumerlaeia bacterium]
MLNKPLDQIEERDIQQLIDDQVIESRTLEYKSELPKFADGEKKRKFLASISSFANTSGGDLIYGLAEVRKEDSSGIAGRIVGIDNTDQDGLKLQLHGIISNGITPRIQNLDYKFVQCEGDKLILIIRIPRSHRRPHMVSHDGRIRFYGRTSSGSHPWDYVEIKDAFLGADQVTERIRNFRLDRIAQIISGKHPVNIMDDHMLVVHVIPFTALETGTVRHVNLKAFDDYLPIQWGGRVDRRYNFDGIVTCPGDRHDGSTAYCQIFRNGIIETAISIFISGNEGHLYVEKGVVESDSVDIVTKSRAKLREEGIDETLVIFISILNTSQLRISKRNASFDSRDTINEDNLLFPEVLVDDANTQEADALQPIFDAFWQSSGYERCFLYDNEGNFVLPKRYY